MNKLFTKIGTAMVGIAMAIGVGVAVGVRDELDKHAEVVYAAPDEEHEISSFTGKGEPGTVLNNGNTPDDISISDPGYPIKAVKIEWSHNKTGTARVTATITVGGEDFGTGQLAFSAPDNPVVISSEEPMSGAIEITWSNSFSSNKNGGTLKLNNLWLVEGEASTKTATTLTLTAAGSKTRLEKGEKVQLSSVVKDNEANVIGGAAVTYSSSDETVATVSETGLVTASSSKTGSTIITASYAGDETYRSCNAKLTIKVIDPLLSSFVIEDVADEQGWEDAKQCFNAGTIGYVTVTGSGTGNNAKYYTNGENWRFYSSGDGAITVAVSGFYYLETVTFTADDYYFTTAPTNWTYSSKVFTASDRLQKTVTFASGSGTSKITQIDVVIAFDWCGYFLDTFLCWGVNVDHPNGDIKVENPTTVWADLSTKFSNSDSALKTALKTMSADEGGTTEQKALARYDLVIRKYGKATYNDFIERFSTGGANQNGLMPVNGFVANGSVTPIVIIASVVAMITIGGIFFIRKRKEDR